MNKPVVVFGVVGWRNVEDARTEQQLDVYGPEGRWAGPKGKGQALIDELVNAGVDEGWTLTIIATPR